MPLTKFTCTNIEPRPDLGPPACLCCYKQDRVGAAEHAAAATGSRTPQEFLSNVVLPMMAMEGDKLPVR